jgi:hypothetical protein
MNYSELETNYDLPWWAFLLLVIGCIVALQKQSMSGEVTG